jgi:hypothetical protein
MPCAAKGRKGLHKKGKWEISKSTIPANKSQGMKRLHVSSGFRASFGQWALKEKNHMVYYRLTPLSQKKRERGRKEYVHALPNATPHCAL